MDTTLTREQAKEMIAEGHKITHEYFPVEVYSKGTPGFIKDSSYPEVDKEIPEKEFWNYFNDKKFDTGWSIVKDTVDRMAGGAISF